MLQCAFVAPGGRTRNNAWKSQGDKSDSVGGRIFSLWGLLLRERLPAESLLFLST